MGSSAFTANLRTCLFCTFNFQLHATGIYISSILNMGLLFPNHESSLVWCQNLELNMIQDSTVLRTIGSNQAGTWGWITARISAGPSVIQHLHERRTFLATLYARLSPCEDNKQLYSSHKDARTVKDILHSKVSSATRSRRRTVSFLIPRSTNPCHHRSFWIMESNI